jgi:CheY-like chemotaxis protein
MNKSVQKKVLIVDDEPDVRYLFSRILLKRDLKPGYANNLAEAYKSVKSEPPSLVFLDNSLPDGQGVEFIPYLKLHYPGTRVVVVTANDSASDKNRAFQLGADDFLGKPLSLELINRTLDKINDSSKPV